MKNYTVQQKIYFSSDNNYTVERKNKNNNNYYAKKRNIMSLNAFRFIIPLR